MCISLLLTRVFRQTDDCFVGEFLEPRQGAAMGSPVSAMVANLSYAGDLALESAPSRPRLWKQYVDDVLHP